MTEHPMRRKDRQLSLEETWQVVQRGTHGVLCLTDADGWPYGVPMNYAVSNGRLYLHCAKAGHKLEALVQNDRACFTIVTQAQVVPEHITTLYESAMVFGTAHLVTDPQEHDAALAALIDTLGQVSPSLRDQYIAKKSKNTAVLVLTPLRLTGKASRTYTPVTQRM